MSRVCAQVCYATDMNPLTSAAWLLEHHLDSDVRLVDARFLLGQPNAGREAYDAGHIPGAIFLDLERDLSSPKRADGRGGRHPLPDPNVLASRLSELGIGNGHSVITYDDPSSGQGFYAAHVWWLLRHLGHDRVSVLDGGFPAWIAAGGKLEDDLPFYGRASFTPRVRPEMLVDAEGVTARASGTILIDSRAAPRYRGEVEPIDAKAGHIPGAINLDWSASLEPDGTFTNSTAQAERFTMLENTEEILVYCGSGVSACGNLLALEVAGIPGAKLYAGSWSDWIAQPDAPIVLGAEPGSS
jgi:thiosulfate/3-mercaptopyruvate sulfurtransferase